MKSSNILSRFLIATFVIGGLVFLSGCLDEIEFASADTIDESIAIQGKIVKGEPSFVSITIRGVFNFTDVPRLLNAREVTVEDESGNTVEIPTNADGIFFLEIPEEHEFDVEFGKSYKVNVSTFDNRNFSSTLEELLPAPTPDDLIVERAQIETQDVNGNTNLFDQLVYSISTPLQAPGSFENSRLLWELITTFKFTDTPEAYGRRACFPTQIDEVGKTCFITSSPIANYVTLDGPDLSVDRVDDMEVLTTGLGTVYAEGFYLSVLQQSLSPTAFAYWEQVGNVVSRDGSLFQPPAGRVITNLVNTEDPDDDVFGYFYATQEFTRRIFVDPDLADNPALPCPSPINEAGQAANDCCNCLTAGVATTERPFWWIN